MKQNYTQDHLIQFIYKEVPATDYFEINDAIESDATLRKRYLKLLSAYRHLPKVRFNPSEAVINRILGLSNCKSIPVQC